MRYKFEKFKSKKKGKPDGRPKMRGFEKEEDKIDYNRLVRENDLASLEDKLDEES